MQCYRKNDLDAGCCIVENNHFEHQDTFSHEKITQIHARRRLSPLMKSAETPRITAENHDVFKVAVNIPESAEDSKKNAEFYCREARNDDVA